METTVFNPIQLQLLRLFSHMHSEEELKELQQLLIQYRFKKLEEQAAKIYKEQGWTPEILEAMSNGHFRIPYK